ncbi:MAG: cytochrome P450 [bacterium]|nr:cytochrome P450 [bacterium]
MVKSIPKYPAPPIIGALSEFRADQLGFLLRARDRFGDIVEIPFFTQRVILINHPDLIQAVLVEHADKVQKSPLDHAIFRQSLGQGLITNEGAAHKQQRKLMQPAFHAKRIENYGAVTTDFTEKLIADWRTGGQVDIHDAMTKLTLFVVSKVLYDADLSQQADGIGEAVHLINHEGEEQYKQGFTVPSWIPIPQNRRIQRAVKDLDAALMPVIEARRKSGEDRGDLLSMLLAAQDEETGSGMTDQQVRDEAATLFVAGHETTSNALSWTWYLLAQHPDAEAKLHAELDAVLAGRTPTLADLPKLKYTEQVIKESMRLYPPAWILNGRAPQENFEIDGYRLEKGTVAFISPYVMHRDPRYFEQVDQFMPERWTPEFEKALPRYAYFPFGGGPRVCIGNSFAMMEARLVLATMAQRYALRVDQAAPVVPEALITLRPKNGIRMRIERRTPQVESAETAGTNTQTPVSMQA